MLNVGRERLRFSGLGCILLANSLQGPLPETTRRAGAQHHRRPLLLEPALIIESNLKSYLYIRVLQLLSLVSSTSARWRLEYAHTHLRAFL